MKAPLSWLRDYVDIDAAPAELAHSLTLAGIEAEGFEVVGEHWDGVAVGLVTAVEPHPNADRLRLATVDTGDGMAQVVCGAPNVAVGQKIAFAREGATLIDAHTGRISKLKAAKIRGVESRGMVCSERELGLSEEHEGILVLDDAAPLGRPLADYLGDVIFDFAITPNRPDLLSILGLAREAAAQTGRAAREPDLDYAEEGPRRRIEDQRRDSRPRPLPALHRRRRHRHHDRPVAPLAAGAARRLRLAVDQQRRRRHQLRDAGDGAAAPRLRLRPPRREPHRRSARAPRRMDHHHRRPTPGARRRHAGHRRRRAARRPGRRHGRRGQRSHRRDGQPAPGIGELQPGEHPAHVPEDGPPQRGLDQVRQGPQPRTAPARRTPRAEAHRRGRRRRGRRRTGRRLPRRAAPPDGAAHRGADCAGARRGDAGERGRGPPGSARLSARAPPAKERTRRHRALLAYRHRDRRRPHRGDRPPQRLRLGADDRPPRPCPRLRTPAHARPQARGPGRATGSRIRRDHHLLAHQPRGPGQVPRRRRGGPAGREPPIERADRAAKEPPRRSAANARVERAP